MFAYIFFIKNAQKKKCLINNLPATLTKGNFSKGKYGEK